MNFRRRKRQALFFLFAILIPSAVLITLAVRVVRQEAELSEKRSADERRDALEQVRRELAARVETIKLQEVNRLLDEPRLPGSRRAEDSPVIFVAPLEQDRMILPWETKQPVIRSAADYLKHQQDGESQEFVTGEPWAAAAAYKRAFEAARTLLERCQAQLWEGRALSRAGRLDKASAIYRPMLDKCDDSGDDDGIAFSLYAAERLITAGLHFDDAHRFVLERTRRAGWRRPTEAYLLRSLLRTVSTGEAGAAEEKLSGEIRVMEQMLSLARDLRVPMLLMGSMSGRKPGETVWLAYGDEPWLIAVMSPAPFAGSVVLAVSTKRISPPDVILHARETPDSQPLGAGFPDLHAEWPPGRFEAGTGTPRSLYAAGIALILGATILAGYLLLRDVNREVQMAEVRSHFVANVSHELKTPLTAIRMFAETLVMGRASDQRTSTEYLRLIVNESERLSRLVDNVLDFSRIERGRKIYQMKVVRPADIVRAAARAMQYPLAQHGFTLKLRVDDSTPPLLADADAMQQAILNLLTNAMKYSGESRVIELSLGCAGAEAVINVSDQGFGIARDDQKRIFEEFYRVRSTKTDPIPGTGLGLTLAMHIVKAHRGRLEMTSNTGPGSTFSIHIPLDQAEAHS